MRPAVTFHIAAVYQLRLGLLRVRVLVASRGHFSGITCVPVLSHAAGVKMEPVKVAKVIRSEKGKDLLVTKGFKFRFQKILADNMERGCCTNKNFKCYIKCNENREIFRRNVMHNHNADTEACLNRHIFNNYVKRKAMDLCERPRKLIHKELLSQDLDTVTYKDIRNISRNMHKARSSQLLPLSTDNKENHEALSAVQVQPSSKELFFFVNDSEKTL